MHCRSAVVDGIQKNLGQIEEGVLTIQLGAKRAGLVGEDFIFDLCAFFRAAHAPPAFIQLTEGKRVPCGASGVHPVDVLREVANLIKRVPDRQLQIMFGGARRE